MDILPQTAHIRFHFRKRVYTLLLVSKIAHSGSQGQTGGVFVRGCMVAGLNKFLRVYYGKVTELYRSLQAIE